MLEHIDRFAGLSLLQTDDRPRNLVATGTRLAHLLRVPPPDAIQYLSRFPGALVAERLRGELAERFAACLREDGHSVKLLRADQMLEDSSLGAIVWIQLDDRGMQLDEAVFEWGEIGLVAAANVEVVSGTESEMQRPGGPKSMGVMFKKIETYGSESVVDIYDLKGRHARLSQKRLRYDRLPERAPSAKANFKNVIDTITARAVHARRMMEPQNLKEEAFAAHCRGWLHQHVYAD